MVNVTKGKNVIVETYDAEFKEFTATAGQTVFVMENAAAETAVEYSRAYVDNVEVTITSIVNSGTPEKANVTIPACTVGQIVQIYVPKTKNGAFSVQQDVRFRVTTRTEDIRELGNDAVTRDVVERVGTLDMTLAQPANQTAMNKLSLNSKNDTWMVVAAKYLNTTPASYRIFKEARVNELGAGVAAGGILTETASFNWKTPLSIKTS